PVLGDRGADLRLHPVLHPPRIRRPRPDRRQPARGRPRPRGVGLAHLPPRHPAAELAEHPRRDDPDHAADVRRLLHERPDLGLAEHQHARQQRQPPRPGRPAEEPRRGDGPGPDDAAGHRDALLPLGNEPPGAEAGGRNRNPPIRPSRVPDWLSNPWGRPRFLSLTTWLYIVWALVPVLFAIAFSFNDGRSRSVWQGFSTRWWWGDDTFSVFHDP